MVNRSGGADLGGKQRGEAPATPVSEVNSAAGNRSGSSSDLKTEKPSDGRDGAFVGNEGGAGGEQPGANLNEIVPAPNADPASRPHAYRMPPVGDSAQDVVTRYFIDMEECMAQGKACDSAKITESFVRAFTAHMGDAPRLGKAQGGSGQPSGAGKAGKDK